MVALHWRRGGGCQGRGGGRDGRGEPAVSEVANTEEVPVRRCAAVPGIEEVTGLRKLAAAREPI